MISCFVNILCNTPAVASHDMLQKVLRLRRHKLKISMRKLLMIQSGPEFMETWNFYKNINQHFKILSFSQLVTSWTPSPLQHPDIFSPVGPQSESLNLATFSDAPAASGWKAAKWVILMSGISSSHLSFLENTNTQTT